ncbi:MAG TPA: hypothetical protein PLR25_19130 [Planctomycetaceae bacterium]|nr:hypothetical protein [Planctomycetaceae bacterium]
MIVIAELIALVTALRNANLPFAVCGGLAMAIHGHPRATQDIDIIIREENLNEVLEVAKTTGFWIPSGRMPFNAKTPMAMEIYRVSKAVGDKLIPLDLMLVSPALEEIWDGRISGSIGDAECTVVSIDGLIHMKEIAARTQDLADIEKLRAGDTR